MGKLESVIKDSSSSKEDIDQGIRGVWEAQREITKADLNEELIRGRGVPFEKMSDEDKKFVNHSLSRTSAAVRAIGEINSTNMTRSFDPKRILSTYMSEIEKTKKSYPKYSAQELTEAYEETTNTYEGVLIEEVHKNGCGCYDCDKGNYIQEDSVDPSMQKLIDVGLVKRKY